MSFPFLFLASGSPRRREMLTWLGWPFEPVRASIDETPIAGEEPGAYVMRLATAKAHNAWHAGLDGGTVLAADTTVADGKELMGKPANPEDAVRMLVQLRGRVHQVYTAVALLKEGVLYTDLCVTQVRMRNYSQAEIGTYVDSGDPLDKAGAYAIQNEGFRPVEDFGGCFASVAGLPMCHLVRTVRRMGGEVSKKPCQVCLEYFGYTCPINRSVLAGEDLG